ncbi:hypothetical protein [Herbidospora mongoliensis]|uniref:hypothetical protein n=1 Tax=Herbidospora mongoliensis TaxID=688067 RepID=UPI001C3F23CE|nr:hypothetical protein [Herbidospora mongoliensis]
MARSALIVLIAMLATACSSEAPATEAGGQGNSSPDPVRALASLLSEGRGVTVAEHQETQVEGDELNQGERKGTILLSPSGVEGFDVTMKTDLMDSASRSVALGPHTYQSGGPVGEMLPKGKKWMQWPSEPGKRSPFFSPVLILEPSTLKALLATQEDQKADMRTGKITLAALAAASPAFAADESARPGTLVVAWQMWVDPKGLPIRLVTEYADPKAPLGATTWRSDIAFSAWGEPVTLEAPPAKLVTTDS